MGSSTAGSAPPSSGPSAGASAAMDVPVASAAVAAAATVADPVAVGSGPSDDGTASGARGVEATKHINLQASIKALQRQKRALQLQLRSYEDTFFKEHGRKVKYQRDIMPVAEDYQRYKEIKGALAAIKP